MSVPFFHLAFIAIVAVVSGGLRGTRLGERWWLPPLLGVAAAAGCALVGWIPWFGDYRLTAYGACLAGAFVVAYLIAKPRLARRGVSERNLIDLMLVALVLGLVGARARFVWENRDEFLRAGDGTPQPWPATLAQMADFDGGGMVWYGGLLLAVAGGFILAWRRRIALLPLADLVTPAILAGLGVGRLGCWFNGCCYGAPTSVPWGVCRPPEHPSPIHPTQLYETAATWALAGLLLAIDRKPRPPGVIAALGCLGYGAWRFFNESLRGDHHAGARVFWPLVGDISTSQATSVYIALGGLVLLAVAVSRRSSTEPPEAPPAR